MMKIFNFQRREDLSFSYKYLIVENNIYVLKNIDNSKICWFRNISKSLRVNVCEIFIQNIILFIENKVSIHC